MLLTTQIQSPTSMFDSTGRKMVTMVRQKPSIGTQINQIFVEYEHGSESVSGLYYFAETKSWTNHSPSIMIRKQNEFTISHLLTLLKQWDALHANCTTWLTRRNSAYSRVILSGLVPAAPSFPKDSQPNKSSRSCDGEAKAGSAIYETLSALQQNRIGQLTQQSKFQIYNLPTTKINS